MPIQFRFHPEKAIEAAAVFLKLHDRPMKYLGLLKMLYIADRIALKRIEQPITGDRYVSMNYGPVLSGVYDLIKGNPIDNALPLWSKFITRPEQNEHLVSLLNDPGNADLCEEEEEIIQEVYQAFGDLDPFLVAEWTHDLPEWQDPHGSAIPIAVEDILKNVGKSDEEIGEIQQLAIREAYLDGVLMGNSDEKIAEVQQSAIREAYLDEVLNG
ncbi:SocA family protein [Lyngbya sp. CCAP 1446/10]|uniref:Panacea domain-containing protein n=1 Tax=Lyngbya sp. CCAP 1446/10 TaxID=439293 RepID=UPI0022373338|nr:Panacea domain-containing protein [Lyngbya sp. CCAP 1446/10]MCW6050299.1 SocA family protein [Lyngbya sp. CCAP 1446/10]